MSRNCWDVMNCPKERMKACPAFTQEKGKDCWTVAGTEEQTAAMEEVTSSMMLLSQMVSELQEVTEWFRV